MEPKILVYALVSFLHDLFTAVWMGGLIVAAITVLPAAREALGPGPQMKKMMAAFQKRQSLWVYISMAGLIITGLLMTNRSAQFTGLFAFDTPYSAALSVKHVLVLLMIGIALVRALVLSRPAGGASPEKERLNLQLLLLNAALAVIVLFVSGLAAALARPL